MGQTQSNDNPEQEPIAIDWVFPVSAIVFSCIVVNVVYKFVVPYTTGLISPSLPNLKVFSLGDLLDYVIATPISMFSSTYIFAMLMLMLTTWRKCGKVDAKIAAKNAFGGPVVVFILILVAGILMTFLPMKVVPLLVVHFLVNTKYSPIANFVVHPLLVIIGLVLFGGLVSQRTALDQTCTTPPVEEQQQQQQ